MTCGNFIANIVGIEATAPAGSTSHDRHDRHALERQRRPAGGADGDPERRRHDEHEHRRLATNTAGDLTNVGHVTGTITTPTQVVLFTAAVKVGPSAPDACTVKGSAIGIPR